MKTILIIASLFFFGCADRDDGEVKEIKGHESITLKNTYVLTNVITRIKMDSPGVFCYIYESNISCVKEF